jgi:type IV fimbrial biogenesis protein FimT
MGKKHREGFTLIELLVLMMVMALTLGIGVPAFVTMMANARMSAAANDLVSSLHAARSEASVRGRTVTLCASADWGADAPACAASRSILEGWIVFEDRDADGAVGAAEPVLQAHGPLDARIAAAPSSGTDGGATEYVSFRPDGFLQDLPGLGASLRNIQLCDERGDAGTGGDTAAGRWVIVTPAGRPALVDDRARIQGDANPLGGC